VIKAPTANDGVMPELTFKPHVPYSKTFPEFAANESAVKNPTIVAPVAPHCGNEMILLLLPLWAVAAAKRPASGCRA
jgi:hypothetical protein